MAVPPSEQDGPGVGEVVEAFESALARGDSCDVSDFAPSSDHPGRLAILCELVRVDLEHRWEAGRPRRLEEYRSAFPTLFEDRELVRAMAYEEFRLRLQAGEEPTAEEYSRRFGLEGGTWPSPLVASPRRTPSPAPLFDRQGPGDGVSEMGRTGGAYKTYRRAATGGVEEGGSLLDSLRLPLVQSELLRSLDRTDPHAAERLAEALAGLPRDGTNFLGFRLCGELGRGAFGRVFLARQGDLADRLVALKVSADVAGESHALARLQHTNIVPIYSVHRRGAMQAVCMPYLGSTTLADTLSFLRSQAALPRSGEGLLSSLRSPKTAAASAGHRDSAGEQAVSEIPGPAAVEPVAPDPSPEEPRPPQIERLRGLGYVPAVLWVMARVADGLAHAHERGILHRDLKPANILFADDGEPVLLDFNLAADTTPRAGAAVALVGGTLPYMAPEQLAAFLKNEAVVDARSDVYSLGVILHELLTGAPPFPIRTGPVDAILPEMIADRFGPPPDVRRANPAVPEAVASIVRHCLEPEPGRRFASARQLQEDLARQLDDRPLLHAPDRSARERLGKWARRHPRLTSSTTVGLVAALVLAVAGSTLVVRHRQYRGAVAAESFRQFGEGRRQAAALLMTPYDDPALVEEGLGLCRLAAKRYDDLDQGGWLDRPLAAALPQADRDRLGGDFGELLVLWAQALIRRAATGEGGPRRLDLEEATSRLDRAESCYGPGARPRALLLARADLARLGAKGEAEVLRLRREAEAVPLRTGRERLLVDPDRVDDGLRRQLLADAEAITGGDPQDFAVWVALGNWNARLGRPAEALTDYDAAVAMAPRLYWTRFNRGLHHLERKDYYRAREDFDRVIERRPDLSSAFLNRALARIGLGDDRGAIADLTHCLALKDAPSRAWFLRARLRQKLGDDRGAQVDKEQGLKGRPRHPADFVARGLARLPGDVAGAVADYDAALAIDPKYRHALQNKANILSETFRQPEQAVKLLDVAVDAHPDFVEALAGRAVLLARLGRRDAAIRDARAALAIERRGLTIYQAACVYALTARQEPADRAEAFRLVAEAVRQEGSWLGVAREDHDLDSIRDQPDFGDLLEALEVVLRAGKAG